MYELSPYILKEEDYDMIIGLLESWFSYVDTFFWLFLFNSVHDLLCMYQKRKEDAYNCTCI